MHFEQINPFPKIQPGYFFFGVSKLHSDVKQPRKIYFLSVSVVVWFCVVSRFFDLKHRANSAWMIPAISNRDRSTFLSISLSFTVFRFSSFSSFSISIPSLIISGRAKLTARAEGIFLSLFSSSPSFVIFQFRISSSRTSTRDYSRRTYSKGVILGLKLYAESATLRGSWRKK